jgi:hypothetical protein
MGEKISWAEGAQQLMAIQSLMLEAMATEYPEVGLLVHTDEPELLIDYMNRAKQKEPILQDIIISIKSAGLVIYHQFRRPENSGDERLKGASDGTQDGSADDAPPRSDL